MKEQHFSSVIRRRVLDFFDYLWVRNKGTHRQSLLADMPYCLRAEVSLATTELLLKNVSETKHWLLQASVYVHVHACACAGILHDIVYLYNIIATPSVHAQYSVPSHLAVVECDCASLQVPIFADVDDAFLRHLTLVIKPCIFLPGEYIVHRGDVGLGMFLLYHGQV